MAGRRKEFVCFCVDVGAHMHGQLPAVEQYLFSYVNTKLINKPTHELALVLFGTDGTNNQVYEEVAASGDDSGQYSNIEVAHEFKCPQLDLLRAVEQLPRGSGRSDFVDALIVVMDMVNKMCEARPEHANASKKLVLVSNFTPQVDGLDMLEATIDTFSKSNMQLEVLSIDVPASGAGAAVADDDQEARANKTQNMEALHQLVASLRGEVKAMSSTCQLLSQVRIKEVAPTATFRGMLEIGNTMKLPVKIFKKVGQEKVPSLKPYNVEAGVDEERATHAVMRSTEWKVPGDPDAILTADDIIQGHRYGGTAIPFTEPELKALSYSVMDKSFKLIGFTPARSQIPRELYLGDTCVVVADYDAKNKGEESNAKAATAMSALVRALHKNKNAAVARLVARNNSRPRVVLLTPLLADNRFRPDCLVMNTLPFREDYRMFEFPPLIPDKQKDKLMPSEAQKEAALRLVDAMDLCAPAPAAAATGGAGGGRARERLQPEQTPNPVLHRFFSLVGHKALDPAAPVPDPEDDPLVAGSLHTPTEVMQAASESLAAMAQLFPTAAPVTGKRGAPEAAAAAAAAGGAGGEEQPAARRARLINLDDEEEGEEGAAGGQAAPLVTSIGMADPQGDFAAMVSQPGYESGAVEGMKRLALQLVDSSVGDANYATVMSLLGALRQGCVEHSMAWEFNAFLKDFADKYRSSEARADIFKRVLDNVSLVTVAECPGAPADKPAATDAEYRAFRVTYLGEGDAGDAAADAGGAPEEDEFEGME